MRAVYFNAFSHMITIMAIRVAVQKQRVAEAAMKTLGYEDISTIRSNDFKPYCPGAERTVEQDRRYSGK